MTASSIALSSAPVFTPQAGEITRLLRAWRLGEEEALGALTPLIYAELRKRAARSMRAERQGHSLQGTELVHEVFLRLAGSDVSWADRAHFLAVATRAMRRILVDHARAKS
ncbi:MAG: ECF-type sigma factor, partial [Acidobacteriota bacterium]